MFKTIICDVEALKMSRIRVGTLPVDANKNCLNCKKILTGGEPVGILPSRDNLGRSKVICLRCKRGE